MRAIAWFLVLLSAAGVNSTVGWGAAPPPPFSYTTSYLGNSSGIPSESTQSNIVCLAVTPDGLCIGNTFWDEGGREVVLYKDGKVLGAAPGTHGWGALGGYTVAANSRYGFAGMMFGSDSFLSVKADIAVAPYDARTRTAYRWFGVYRFDLTGKPAPFVGGKGVGCMGYNGKQGSFAPVVMVVGSVNKVDAHIDANIRGLAASDKKLYISVPYSKKVFIYDPETMQQIGGFDCPNCGPLALNPTNGDLWGIQGGVVTGFTADGVPLGQTIPAVSMPVALAFNPAGQLLIADGRTHTIATYNLNGNAGVLRGAGILPAGSQAGKMPAIQAPGPVEHPAPMLVTTFGTSMLSGPTIGLAGPGRFLNIVGIGTDTAGNLYVASNRTQLDTTIECYNASRQRLWMLQSNGSIIIPGADPAFPNDLYDPFSHLAYDYDKNTWSLVGTSCNPVKHPNDPRLHGAGGTTGHIQWLGGRKFLFTYPMYDGGPFIYRFNASTDGETAIPCAIFAPFTTITGDHKYPPGKPSRGWLWRDLNGDGDFQPNEFALIADGIPAGPADGDSNGDIWIPLPTGIWRYRCGGLDANGVPLYSPRASTMDRIPVPFTGPRAKLCRLLYDASADAMVLCGYTTANPADPKSSWGHVGSTLVRYDHWSNTKTLRYQTLLHYDARNPMDVGRAIAWAGDQIYVCRMTSSNIDVYGKASGVLLGTIIPPPNYWTGAWTDTKPGITATTLPNGDNVVFAEEEVGAKVLVYRIPQSTAVGSR